ncbi:MAG: EamA family transporter [Clostridia bacterium]|nr:EamA family transporter [Clostridia bacterium]
MWLYLSLISAIFTGFTVIVMKKCSKDNLSIRLSLLGLLIGNIAYVIIGALKTDVIQNFNIMNIIKIAPLSIIQSIGYICAILSVKYANVSTVSPIRKGNTVITLILGMLIL